MQMLFGYARLAINFCYPAIIPLFILTVGTVLKAKPKAILILLVVSFAYIAFQFVPSKYDDLYRYWYLVNRYRSYGWDGLQSIYVGNYWFNTSQIQQILLYGFSFLPNWCLPVFMTCATYVLIGILDFRYFKRVDVELRMQGILIVFQFLTIEAYSVISSWLYMLTFAILANILYTDLIEKKRPVVCMVAYVVLGQMHTVSYIIFVFRVFALFCHGRLKWVVYSAILIWRLLVDGLIRLLSPFSCGFFFERILDNVISYSQAEENSNPLYMIALGLLALTFFVSLQMKKYRNQVESKQMNFLLSCCAMLILGSYGSQNLMFRFSHFLCICLPFHVGYVLAKENANKPLRQLTPIAFAYVVAVLLLNVYYTWVPNRLIL